MTHISQIQKDIISNRLPPELRTPEIIEKYFINDLKLVEDLDKLIDIDKASSLLGKHIDKDSQIVIISDRDADGINSAAVLYLGLRKIFNVNEMNLKVIINPRREENGISKYCMDKLWELDSLRQVDLVITSDHGSVNETEYKKIKEEKPWIDLLVTDHHTVQYEVYPESADVFINPQRQENDVFKGISGCQVALLTLVATYKHMYPSKNLDIFNILLPYAALTVISDVMPLDNLYNRYMVKTGLQVMNRFDNPVWIAIKKLLDIPGNITFRDVGYKIAPLINTANRTHNEELGFKLLTAQTLDDAVTYTSSLCELNTKRKSVTAAVTKKANIEVDLDKYPYSIVSLIDSSYAINGLVAASIGGKYHKPVVCFIDSDDILSGSCRANVNGYNILDVLRKVKEADPSIIVKLGGHKGACGCSIYKNKLEAFKKLFDQFSKEEFDRLPPEEKLKPDAIISADDIEPSLGIVLDACGPYGNKWPEPLLVSELKIYRVILKGSYVDIHFSNGLTGGCFIDDLECSIESLVKDTKVNVYYSLGLSSMRGTYKFELVIKHLEIT